MTQLLTQHKGPVMLVLWLILNICLALMNKQAFRMGFKFPILLSSIHMIVASILSHIAIRLKYIERVTMTNEEHENKTRIFTNFSAIYIMNIAFGNISLQIVNLAFSQVVRSVIPFATMITSYWILGSVPSQKIIMSTIPVCLGVALTVYGNVDFSWVAMAVLMVGISLSAMKVTLTNKYLVAYKAMHPIEFLSEICPLSAVYLILFASIRGETYTLINEFDTIPMASIVMACITGIVAFFLNWTNFVANRSTSPLSMTVGGNIKQVATVVLSIILFNTQLKWWNGLGIGIALTGLAFYSYVKYLEREAGKSTKKNPKEMLPTIEPTISEVNQK